MGGKRVARGLPITAHWWILFILALTGEENLADGRHSSSEAVPAPALRLTRMSGALGSRLSFWSRI
jgi:hypothetical protein